MKRGFILFILLAYFAVAQSQTNFVVSADSIEVPVTIDKIFILGNKKTKKKIILRELSVAPGQVYEKDQIEELLRAEKNKINNLRLFNSVKVEALYLSPNLIDVVVQVTERWYTFPVPVFNLVDRNFNDWWQNRNRDLSRTNYGIRLYKNNFRGRNEDLRLIFQLGFTREFGIIYRIPYIDRLQRHGLSFIFQYKENKNTALRTVDHFQEFFDSEELLRLERRFGIGYRFRKSFYTNHSLFLDYFHTEVNDTITTLNPDYHLNNKNDQEYFRLRYRFEYNTVDFVSYPLKGQDLDIEATQSGLGFYNDLERFELQFMYSLYKPLPKDFYFSNYTSVYFSSPGQQPYSNLYGLGYNNDFIRGYELYVIESQNFYLNRTTLKKKLFQFKKRLGFIPFEQFKEIPLAAYFKVHFDMGYAENLKRYEERTINTGLSNRFLYGAGVGLDFVTFYDSVTRFEYSINREGEAGFFLHFKKEF